MFILNINIKYACDILYDITVSATVIYNQCHSKALLFHDLNLIGSSV